MLTPGKILTLFALSGACCFGAVWAQQEDDPPASKRRTGVPQRAEYQSNVGIARSAETQVIEVPVGGAEPSVSTELFGLRSEPYRAATAGFAPANSPANQAFKKAIKQYRDAEADSAERDQARDKVSESLSQLYDEHLEIQERQITELENRLAKLRDQLIRRRDAKDKMVDLKLEMVLSQADGLGWPEYAGGDTLIGIEERYRGPAMSPLRSNSIPAAPIVISSTPVAPAVPAADLAPATERPRTTNRR